MTEKTKQNNIDILSIREQLGIIEMLEFDELTRYIPTKKHEQWSKRFRYLGNNGTKTKLESEEYAFLFIIL